MAESSEQANGLKGEGDRYLIEMIRRGDTEAFAQLVDRFGGRLRAYAARRLGGTGIDAEDAVQETLLGLLQSLDRIDRVRTLQAYLFQILRNKISDLTKRRPEAHGLRQIPLVNRDSNEELHGYEPISPAGTPSSYLKEDETVEVRNRILADILDETISGLRESKNFRDLKILELLFYGSWKNRDIAREVGVSEPTVTRVKAAGLEKLSRLASRHPMMDSTLNPLDPENSTTNLIRTTWRDNLLSCLKRNTLGAYALSALESDWSNYVAFHLDKVRCEFCAANLADLERDEKPMPEATREKIFSSSVGFLRRLKDR